MKICNVWYFVLERHATFVIQCSLVERPLLSSLLQHSALLFCFETMRRIFILGIMVCERFFLFTHQAAMALAVNSGWLTIGFLFGRIFFDFNMCHGCTCKCISFFFCRHDSSEADVEADVVASPQTPDRRTVPMKENTPVHCYLEYINNSGPPSPLSEQDSPFTKRFKSWFWEQGQHGSASSCIDLMSSEDDFCLCLSFFSYLSKCCVFTSF